MQLGALKLAAGATTRAMKPQLHHVVACSVCSLGTLFVLIGAIMFFNAVPRELPVWYQ